VLVDATAIVASTAEERGWLIDLYAAHPERIRLIPPGVDHELFTPPAGGDRGLAKRSLGFEGKQVLLFIGRLQPLKAGDTAIRALAHLIDWGRADPDKIRLIMVGGPSGKAGFGEPQRLQGLASDLGVLDSVDFVAAQPQSELPSYYQAADVCLVPSYNESFGLVALEAQASGVPVVGSAIGGLRSIVRHGQTGFLVEPGRSEAFAERTWRILSDRRIADSMSRLAECSSREFSWDRCASELYDLYTSSVS
ncbi:MAG: glycosyltransferase, partial [Acidimicrobiia bacterium]